jgi:hypothetical protein
MPVLLSLLLLLLLTGTVSAQVPYRADIVEAVHKEHPQLLKENSTPSVAHFRRLVAIRLNTIQPFRWGELTKGPGEHQHAGLAVDAICWMPFGSNDPNGWAVLDIVANAEATDGTAGRPSWQPQARRTSNLCVDVPGSPLVIEQPVVDLAALEALRSALEARLKDLEDKVLLLEEGHALHGTLLSRPLPLYKGRLGPFTVTSQPIGR